MFFVVFSFGTSWTQWSSRFTLTPHGKSMMHRCSFHESISYLGGAMHQCPNCRHYLSWWEKTAATQVRVDTPTKPHEAASLKMDDGPGLVGLVKWFSNNTYKKRIQGWWKSCWVFRVLCLRLAQNGLVALFWGSAFWGWQILCLSSWSQVHKRYETSLILLLGLDPWPLDPLDPPKFFINLTYPLIMRLDVSHLSGQCHHQHWWANHMEINTEILKYCTRNGHETRLL